MWTALHPVLMHMLCTQRKKIIERLKYNQQKKNIIEVEWKRLLLSLAWHMEQEL